MKETTINELLKRDDFYLHFTKKQNLHSIEESGLCAAIGENSKMGSETTPKVFFSKGVEGSIGILNRWLILTQNQENESDLDELYRKFEEKLKDYTYLCLNLKHVPKSIYEGMKDKEKSQIDYLDDDINEENGLQMTTRNMHTIPWKNIDISKIKHIGGEAIDVILRLYNQYKELEKNDRLDVDYLNDEYDKDLLSGFIDFIRQKEKTYLIETSKIGRATVNTPTQAKQDAAKIEKNIHTQDKVNEGESIDDN